ncbi:MAG: bacteriohemerythrin, partial [Lachnospiraceae bacterium]|nr:bacteriohemerythrin [Lachnospiraceae bacterium]
MMKAIPWNDRFNLGVDVIDKAHQKLFSIVGKLVSFNNEDELKQQHACKEGIKYLKSYTLKHFAQEEAYMKSIDYDGYPMHKRLHDNMRDKTLPALEEELEEQNYSIESVQHFLGICIGWLNSHIMTEDFAITGRISKKWVQHTSEDVTTALTNAII